MDRGTSIPRCRENELMSRRQKQEILQGNWSSPGSGTRHLPLRGEVGLAFIPLLSLRSIPKASQGVWGVSLQSQVRALVLTKNPARHKGSKESFGISVSITCGRGVPPSPVITMELRESNQMGRLGLCSCVLE